MSSSPTEGPVLKKLKITPIDEPLKRSDFIHFQKDCLYRTIQDIRIKYDSLKIQYASLVRENDNIVNKLNIFVYSSKGDSSYTVDEILSMDESKILEIINNTDDANRGKEEIDILNLTKNYNSLKVKNKLLSTDLELLKTHYEGIIHQFERNSSDILKRVFKLGEDENDIENENKDKAKKEEQEQEEQKKNYSEGQIVNNSIPEANCKEKSINSSVPSSTASPVTTTATTTNSTPSSSSSSDSANDVNSNSGVSPVDPNTEQIINKAQLLKTELEFQEFEDKIALLEQKIDGLNDQLKESQNSVSILNKEKLNRSVELDQKVASLSDLNKKLETLTKTNNTLVTENSQFLNKFNTLYQEKSDSDLLILNKFTDLQSKINNDVLNMEKDLVRIRTQRDSIQAKNNILQSEKSSSEVVVFLQKTIAAIEEKLTDLEKFHTNSAQQLDGKSDILMNELQELENAYKELSVEALKKFDNYLKHDCLILSKLQTEKSRADEKYYAAMRSKESIIQENKNVCKTLSKSNELVTQLKESEKLVHFKMDNLNKQLNLSRENEKRLLELNKQSSKKVSELMLEGSSHTARYNKVVQENNLLKQDVSSKAKSIEEKDISLKELQTSMDQLEKKYTKLFKNLQIISEKPDLLTMFLSKKNMANGQNNSHGISLHFSNGNKSENELLEELDNFRTIVYCSLCSKNWKNTTLKNCGHVFCDECCKERLNSRMRKCPSCNKPFSSNDLLTIHL